MAEPTEREKYLAKLNDDLERISAAQSFESVPSGKLIIEILESDINHFANQVASDKFINDHNGYLDSRAKLNYASSLLSRISRLKNKKTEKDVRAKIEEAEAEDKGK